MLPHLNEIGIDYVVMGRAIYNNKKIVNALSKSYK